MVIWLAWGVKMGGSSVTGTTSTPSQLPLLGAGA